MLAKDGWWVASRCSMNREAYWIVVSPPEDKTKVCINCVDNDVVIECDM